MVSPMTNTPAFNDKFPEPKSVQEAHERRNTLSIEMDSIRDQLGEHRVAVQPGQREPVHDDWRTRAVRALRIKERQCGALRAWIRSQCTPEDKDGERSIDLLSALYELTMDFVGDDESDLTDQERTLLQKVRDRVDHYRKHYPGAQQPPSQAAA